MTRRRQAQRALQQDLPWRGVEQVGTTDHVGDALVGIVHHDGELVGPQAIGATQHEVADFDIDPLRGMP